MAINVKHLEKIIITIDTEQASAAMSLLEDNGWDIRTSGLHRTGGQKIDRTRYTFAAQRWMKDEKIATIFNLESLSFKFEQMRKLLTTFVSSYIWIDSNHYVCDYCQAHVDADGWHGGEFVFNSCDHSDDCPVKQAQDLLAQFDNE